MSSDRQPGGSFCSSDRQPGGMLTVKLLSVAFAVVGGEAVWAGFPQATSVTAVVIATSAASAQSDPPTTRAGQ
jgi:hypothetical protein